MWARCLWGAAWSAGTATAACSPTTFGDCVGEATAEACCGAATPVDFLAAIPIANAARKARTVPNTIGSTGNGRAAVIARSYARGTARATRARVRSSTLNPCPAGAATSVPCHVVRWNRGEEVLNQMK